MLRESFRNQLETSRLAAMGDELDNPNPRRFGADQPLRAPCVNKVLQDV